MAPITNLHSDVQRLMIEKAFEWATQNIDDTLMSTRLARFEVAVAGMFQSLAKDRELTD